MQVYKSILLGFLFIAFSYSVSAQNYVEAYVIDLRGDTLKGKIHVSDNQENYIRINFFEWGDFERPKQYQPGSILEYGFLNEQRFRSFRLSDEQMIAGNKAVFLKVLIDRPNLLSLFAFRDKKDTVTYFLKTKKGELIRLFPESYRDTLKYFSGNCEGFKTNGEIEGVEYATLDLANFVNEYNGCRDEDYIVDDSYLSDGIRSFGIRLGTGFGFLASSNYPLDSPDLLAALSFEYSLSNINSLIFELGFVKRTMTYEYDQRGEVETFLPLDSYVGDVRTSTILDTRMLKMNLLLKKKLTNFNLLVGGGVGVKLKSSKTNYAAITKNQDFKSQFEESLYVKNEIEMAPVIPSLNLGIGKSFKFNSFDVHGELAVTYLRVKPENAAQMKKSVEIQYRYGNPYTKYTVSKPKLPKLLIDLSLRIPLYSL